MDKLNMKKLFPLYPSFCSFINKEKKMEYNSNNDDNNHYQKNKLKPNRGKDVEKITWCFRNYTTEKKMVKLCLLAHKKYFNTEKREYVIQMCRKHCNISNCLLRQRIKKRKIFINKVPICKKYYCPKHIIERNFCYSCNVDMGERGFTRQLCRKYYCENENI